VSTLLHACFLPGFVTTFWCSFFFLLQAFLCTFFPDCVFPSPSPGPAFCSRFHFDALPRALFYQRQSCIGLLSLRELSPTPSLVLPFFLMPLRVRAGFGIRFSRAFPPSVPLLFPVQMDTFCKNACQRLGLFFPPLSFLIRVLIFKCPFPPFRYVLPPYTLFFLE